MQEMTYKEIDKYFEIIKSNKAFFYCNNRERKPGVGKEVVLFEKMPWGNCKFLFKENCPINKKYYNFRFPFIRYFDNLIHCLAKFN